MYDPETVRRLSINPIGERNIARVQTALEGLTLEFGQEWVETSLYGFDPTKLSQSLGIPLESLLSHWAEFSDLVFLWEDLEEIRRLAGHEQLKANLRRGPRAENVDLEIATAADFCRLAHQVELEPEVGNGKFTDLRFKSHRDSDWTYVEVSRKSGGEVQKILHERGRLQARLVAARDPSRRNYVAITHEMDVDFSDAEFEELVNWIPGSAEAAVFKDLAFVGSVEHGEDETQLVLGSFPGPVSVIQDADYSTGAFGVAYLRVPDRGAENKIKDKLKQVMRGKESILLVDLTAPHAALPDWSEQILRTEESREFCAILLVQHQREASGFSRICKIVRPSNATTIVSKSTETVLEEFAECRRGWKL